MTDAHSPDAVRALAWRQGWMAAVGLLVLLAVLKPLASAFPGGFQIFGVELGVPTLVFTVAAGVQLYYPLHQVGRFGVSDDSLGLSRAGWRAEVMAFVVVSLLTLVGYGLAVHLYQTQILERAFALRILPDLLERALVEVLVIALAEELFFRGFVQERLTTGWPWGPRGATVGAIVLTSLFFAGAHVVGDWRLSRFGPFFPGLIFGALRARGGYIWAAVGYHAFCNLLADILAASYR